MQPKPPDVRQSLSLKQTFPHDWPPGDGVGAGAGPDKYLTLYLVRHSSDSTLTLSFNLPSGPPTQRFGVST